MEVDYFTVFTQPEMRFSTITRIMCANYFALLLAKGKN